MSAPGDQSPAPVSPILILPEEHWGGINDVAVYGGGARAVTAAIDGTLKVWDLEAGEVVRTLSGHSMSVGRAIPFDRERKVLSVSVDHTIRIWDLEKGKLLQTLRGHTGEVSDAILFAKEKRVLTISDDKTMRTWSLEDGAPLQTFRGHTRRVHSAVMDAQEKRIVSASSFGSLKVWDLQEGLLRHTLSDKHDATAFEMMPGPLFANGQRALTGCASDPWLLVWDLETGKIVQTIEHDSVSLTTAVVYDQDRRVLVAHAHQMTAFDLVEGRPLFECKGHRGFVRHAILYAGDRRVLTSSDDHTLKIWDLGSGCLRHSLEGHTDNIRKIKIYERGRRAISASSDCTLRIWDLAALE